MRRCALVLFALALGLALVAPAAAAADPGPSSAPAVPVRAFCHSTDALLHFMSHAPDPRKLDTVKGRRVLRQFHRDAPADVRGATKTITDSFGYLSRHGAHTLSKRRDAKTGDALFRTALFGATHCKQRRIQQLAQGLTQRRLAQAEAKQASTTTTTG